MTRLLFPFLLLTSVSRADVPSLLKSHCLNCHSTEEQKGDLDLETSDIQKESHLWENALEQIKMGEMPPKKEKQLRHSPAWEFSTLKKTSFAL